MCKDSSRPPNLHSSFRRNITADTLFSCHFFRPSNPSRFFNLFSPRTRRRGRLLHPQRRPCCHCRRSSCHRRGHVQRGGKESLCQRGKQAEATQEQEHAGLHYRGSRHGPVSLLGWKGRGGCGSRPWAVLRPGHPARAPVCLARHPVVVAVVMVGRLSVCNPMSGCACVCVCGTTLLSSLLAAAAHQSIVHPE